MVASSVVSTILILNYHHRNADTHEMSEWVSEIGRNKVVFQRRIYIPLKIMLLCAISDECLREN